MSSLRLGRIAMSIGLPFLIAVPRASAAETVPESELRLVGDAQAQAATSTDPKGAFGGGFEYRSRWTSAFLMANVGVQDQTLVSISDKSRFLLEPTASGKPSFELYFARFPDRFRHAINNKVDIGYQAYAAGAATDWDVPPEVDGTGTVLSPGAKKGAVALKAGIAAGVRFLLERTDTQSNYIMAAGFLGAGTRTLAGSVLNHSLATRALGTDKTFFGGPELTLLFQINSLLVRITAPIMFPKVDVDGLTGLQLVGTVELRDGLSILLGNPE